MNYINKKYKWHYLLGLLFVIIIIIVILNLVEDSKTQYRSIKIAIISEEQPSFTQQNEFEMILKKFNIKKGQVIEIEDFKKVESLINTNQYVLKSKAYINNRFDFFLKIYEQKPIARLFFTNGTSYYLSDNLDLMEIKTQHVLEIPIFTQLNYVKTIKPQRNDSFLTKIKNISLFIKQNNYWDSLISNLEIYEDSLFLVYLNSSNEILDLGSLNNPQTSFYLSQKFLNDTWNKFGANYYKQINFRYYQQIVAQKTASTNNLNIINNSLTKNYEIGQNKQDTIQKIPKKIKILTKNVNNPSKNVKKLEKIVNKTKKPALLLKKTNSSKPQKKIMKPKAQLKKPNKKTN